MTPSSNEADRRMPADTADWIKRLLDDDPWTEEKEAAGRLESRVRERVDGIERLLELKHRARVLDLGCGSGRQTIELASRAYRVLGMDAASLSLSGARSVARGGSLTLHFLAGDMRRIPYSSEFDAVINLQRPIGCFPAERDDLQCLQAVHRALKVGGKLLLDLVNREWLIWQLGRQPTAAGVFDLETGRLDCRGLLPGKSVRPSVMGANLRIYSLTELRSLLDRAGLTFRKVWGDFEGAPYEIHSLRMIVLAEKCPVPASPRKTDDLPSALRIKGRPR